MAAVGTWYEGRIDAPTSGDSATIEVRAVSGGHTESDTIRVDLVEGGT
jgi:hypothetical protein